MSTITSRSTSKNNLEIATEKPNLRLIMSELESAQTSIDYYLGRNRHAYDFWQSRWPGQTTTGRKESPTAFPWENASDVRMRTAKQVVRDHVTFGLTVFRGARLQAKSMRPMAPGQSRRSNQITKLLQWEVGVHMRPNLNREVPLALNWRFGYGAAVIGVDWLTRRRLEFHPLTVPSLAEWIAMQDGVSEQDFPILLVEIQSALSDPAQEDVLAGYVQSLSPDILTLGKSRKIVRELRQLSASEVPVPYVFKSLPVWTALRPAVEILFPGEACDLQEETWTARRELITETNLRDRIETEEYDGKFVEEAVLQKGKGLDSLWIQRTLQERGVSQNKFEHLIELIHFDSLAIRDGVPCKYRTVFCPHVLQGKGNNFADFYAKHSAEGYAHGQVPYVELRHEREDRPILSSQGIPETVYTWEQAIKRQIDGVTDLSDLQLQPPLITPYNRVHALAGSLKPGATLGAGRMNEFNFMTPPRTDGTPVQIIQRLEGMIERHFPIFAEERPVLMQTYQGNLAGELLGEYETATDQTFQLMQEFTPEDEVAAVAGPLQRPFHVSRAEIQQQLEITAVFDPRMQDAEYMKEKIGRMLEAMQFNQNGGANTAGIFRNIMENIDPDAADEMVDDTQVATARERTDEQNALALMLNGIEPDKPMFGNHQERLQVLQEKLADPRTQARISNAPDAQDVWALIQNRMEFHQNQIQQYTENPGIGRALSTQTFNKSKAPVLQLAGA